MHTSVRLAIGANFQLAKAIGAPINPAPNTTLNEAINNRSIVPFQPDTPTQGMEVVEEYNPITDSINNNIQYIAIGTGGRILKSNPKTGKPKVTKIPHKARDTGLFEIIPWMIRDIDNDLTAEQRRHYRLRKTIEVGGVLKVAYFLKRVDLSQATITQQIVKIDRGSKTATNYTPTVNDLKPDIHELNGPNDGTFINTKVNIELNITAEEAEALRHVGEVWYGDSEDLVISEIAICSGCEKRVIKKYPNTGRQTALNVNQELLEATAVQAIIIRSTKHEMDFYNGSVGEDINLGTEDVLYSTNPNT